MSEIIVFTVCTNEVFLLIIMLEVRGKGLVWLVLVPITENAAAHKQKGGKNDLMDKSVYLWIAFSKLHKNIICTVVVFNHSHHCFFGQQILCNNHWSADF